MESLQNKIPYLENYLKFQKYCEDSIKNAEFLENIFKKLLENKEIFFKDLICFLEKNEESKQKKKIDINSILNDNKTNSKKISLFNDVFEETSSIGKRISKAKINTDKENKK